MRSSQEIIGHIGTIYLEKYELTKLKDTIKQVLTDTFIETEEDRIEIDGLIIQNRSKTKMSFRDDLYEYLEDRASLPLAVNVTKKAEDRFNISPFQLPAESYIRFTPSISKLEKELMQEKFESVSSLLKEKSLEEQITLYRSFKKRLDASEMLYELLRTDLKKAFIAEEKQTISADCGTFSLLDKKSDYAISEMFSKGIEKKLHIGFKKTKKGVECLNLHTKESFSFPSSEQAEHEEHIFTYIKNTLYVDGEQMPIIVPPTAMTDFYALTQSIVSVEPMSFLKTCPFSATKLQGLVDSGLLDQGDLDRFKFIESEESFSSFVEIIEDESEKVRSEMFHRQRLTKSKFRQERNETVQHLQESS